MRIVTYAELQDREQLMPLMYHGHGWALDYRGFEERIGQDSRLRNGPAALCAVEGDRLVGIAGVMTHPSRTLKGTEPVGGVTFVVTHPKATRRGICTALFEAAHQWFRSRGYRFAFLTTNRTWHAYDLYVRMGYAEVEAINSYPTAYALMLPKQPAATAAATPVDLTAVSKLFAEVNVHRTGFSVRYDDLPQVMATRGRLDLAQSVLLDGGYALVMAREGGLEVREIAARDAAAQKSVLDALNEKGPKFVLDPVVPDGDLALGYERHGYRLERGSHAVLMAKPLDADTSLRDVYGDDFYISPMEWF
jgi:GNAT superfamily N-acetyltransferase